MKLDPRKPHEEFYDPLPDDEEEGDGFIDPFADEPEFPPDFNEQYEI